MFSHFCFGDILLLTFLVKRSLSASVCTAPVNVGYDVNTVSQLATAAAQANWEWGTQAEALLELSNPDVNVFSTTAFPNGKIPNVSTVGTTYAKKHILTTGNTLTAAGVAAGDPASLGVSAILLGQSDPIYAEAATRQVDTLLYHTKRYSNGAISHRSDAVMLWSDFIYMVPPTLAYEGVATQNQSLLREAVNQISLYRSALEDTNTGLWTHIIGSRRDAGTWSTGNGWVLGGMARVLATILHWPTSEGWTTEQQTLIGYAKEIIDGAINVGPEASSGLLRNYISNSSTFPEGAGTAMIAANMYRFAVIAPGTFATSKYLNWADARRAAVAKIVKSNGQLSPVVDPYNYSQNTAYDSTSPESESFAVLLYAAYRDCICAGVCKA